MRVPRSLRAGAIGIGLTIGLVACSSGGGSPAAGSPSMSSAASAAAATPSESMAAATSTPQASAAALNLDTAAGGVSSLKSYAMDITEKSGGETQTFSLLATSDPVKSTHYTLGGSSAMELISIDGQGAWIKQGTTWVTVPGSVQTYLSLFDAWAPDRLIGTFALAQWTGAGAVNTETHNGVSSYHLHVDSSTATAAGVTDFPPNGSVDAWVAVDGGYLVGMTYQGADPSTGQDTSLDVEVTRVNDPSIVIEAPPTS